MYRTSDLRVLNDQGAATGQAVRVEPPEDQVRIWMEDHRVPSDELETSSALVDAGERQRASRFRVRKHCRRFVLGHAHLRSILALYSGGRADALDIARRCGICGSEEHGKPFPLLSSNAPSSIRFSYSYSDQLVVIAVSNGAELGVNVERIVADLAWRAFFPRERAESSLDRSWVGKLIELPGHEAAVVVEGASPCAWSVRGYGHGL